MSTTNIRIHNSYDLIALPLKGIRLALIAIEESIALIEELYYKAMDGVIESAEAMTGIKKQGKWIKRIIKKARLKNLYPLKGDSFSLTLSGGMKIEIELEKLFLPDALLKAGQANPCYSSDTLNGYKQRLLYNFEVIYVATLLAESYQTLFNQGRGREPAVQEKIPAVVFQELMATARRYCIRLSSGFFPGYAREKYYELFVFFWQQIEPLINTFQTQLTIRERRDILYLILKLKTITNLQDGMQTPNALGNLLNRILDQPFSQSRREYAYG